MSNADLRTLLNEELAKFFSPLNNRLDTLEAKLDGKAEANRVYTTLDGLVTRLATDDQERSIMSHQLNRHQDWIKRASQHLKSSTIRQRE